MNILYLGITEITVRTADFTEVQNVNAKYIEGKIWLQISPSKKPALIK